MAAAGQAAAASSGDAAQGVQSDGEAERVAPAGFDWQALQEQLQSTAGDVSELRSQFSQFLDAPPWDAGAELDADAEFETGPEDLGEPFEAGYTDVDQEAEELADIVRQHSADAARSAVGPVQAQMAEMARQQAIRDLVTAHPELQDPAIAARVAGPGGLAHTLAEAMGRPDLAHDPMFWGVVHQADRAHAAAAAEAEHEDPAAATLESGVASAGGGRGRTDTATEIISGGPMRSRVLPFGS